MKLIGLARLGRDAELRRTPGGDAVCNLALAFDYGPKDNKKTTWVDAALWRERAEGLAEYMLKGQQLYVEVRNIRVETYQGQNGAGAKLVGDVAELEFGARPAIQGDGGQGHDTRQQGQQRSQGGQQQRPQQGQQRPTGGQQRPAPRQPSSGFDDMADDIPF
jgi:single-strand DNA-binding protein